MIYSFAPVHAPVDHDLSDMWRVWIINGSSKRVKAPLAERATHYYDQNQINLIRSFSDKNNTLKKKRSKFGSIFKSYGIRNYLISEAVGWRSSFGMSRLLKTWFTSLKLFYGGPAAGKSTLNRLGKTWPDHIIFHVPSEFKPPPQAEEREPPGAASTAALRRVLLRFKNRRGKTPILKPAVINTR